MVEAVPVVVTVEDSARLDEIRAASEKHGMKSVAMLRGLGMFKGVVNPQAIRNIARLPGVRSVEQERENKIRSSG